MNANNELRHARVLSQWIVSLAVSVVCCAVLFLVFARYIVEIHASSSLAMVRIEALQDRQSQLVAELDALRRPIPVTYTKSAVPEVQPVVPPQISPVPVVPQTIDMVAPNATETKP